MSEVKTQAEPSMEEILASIRRIIAEDNEPVKDVEPTLPPVPPEPEMENGASAAALHRGFEPDDAALDVLELTEIVAEEPAAAASEVSSFEAKPAARPEPAPAPRPEPAPFRMPEPAFAVRDDERLVSPATAAASTAAFAGIAGKLKLRAGDLPIGNGALTLEELVRDLVRPMLKDWLDENLPGLVERLVQDEIRRLAKDAF